jgi:predicted RNase H-like HicB family nuclease
MTVQVATRSQVEYTAAPDSGGLLTAVAVFDGDQWVTICRELGIASQGDSPDDAIVHLRAAIEEATEVARENGVQAGEPLSDAELETLLRSHRGFKAIVVERFTA